MPCIHDLFELRASLSSDHVAILCKDHSVSYSSLSEQSNSIAHALTKRGVRQGHFVGIALERSADFIVSMLGVLKAGACCVPLDPANPLDRAQYIARRAELAAVLVDESTAHARIAATKLLVAEAAQSPSAGYRPGQVASDSAAFLFFTSGSTGRPKGVLMSHRARVASVTWLQQNLGAPRVHLFKSSIGQNPMIREVFWPLLTGGVSVVAPDGTQRDAAYIKSLLQAHKIEVVGFTPSMLKVFLEGASPSDFASVKYIICGGETIEQSTIRRSLEVMPHAHLLRFYGLTEVGMALHLRVKPEDDHRSLGHPTYLSAYLVNKDMKPVADGEIGELCLSGVGLADGYFKDEERTRASFVPDPFKPDAVMFRTGDYASKTESGAYTYHGRRDRRVKLRGVRVELDEIEAAAKRILHVADAHALMVTRKNRVQMHCFCTTRSGALDCRSLYQALRDQLPSAMMPHRVHLVPEIPVLPSGKADFRQLDAFAQSAASAEHSSPADGIPESWKQILATDDIAAEDRLYSDLGGDSLLAMELLMAIEKEFGIALDAELLSRDPSIAEILALVQSPPARYASVDEPEETLAHTAETHAMTDGQVATLGSPAAWLQYVLRIQGHFDPARLEDSVMQCLAQNGIKSAKADETYREILYGASTPEDDPFEMTWLTGSAQECVVAAHALLREFSFSKHPATPLRIHVVSISPTDFVALFKFNGLFFDGYSVDVFGREVSRLYAGEHGDLSKAEKKHSLSDVARWERFFYTDRSIVLEQHARERCALAVSWRGVSPPDFDASSIQATVTRKCFSGLDLPLRQLAARARISSTRIFLGIVALAFARTYDSRRVVIDVMSSNRNHPKLRQVIAPLSVRIPLLFEFEDDDVTSVLQQIRLATDRLLIQHPPLPLILGADPGTGLVKPRLLISQIVGGLRGLQLPPCVTAQPGPEASDAQPHIIDTHTDLVIRFAATAGDWIVKFIHRPDEMAKGIISRVVPEIERQSEHLAR